ncbi:MAG TPA: hypothetical protein VMI10_05455 [Terriglobales bacterium]|nr:hypothetical protein [Terriglobales bacterium]
MFLRLNKKGWSEDQASSGVVYERLELGSNVSYSTDDSVDVAVIPIVFAITNYEAESIHVAEFADSSITSAIGAGSQVLSAGLLPAFPGIWRNYPVFKFGHVSSKPSERIPVPCAPNEAPRWLRVWLLDASLVPGNSGAPIIQMPQILSGEHAALLGLQSISFMGNDVAGMTPVKYIYEVLEKLALKDADLRLPSQVQDAPKPTPPPNKPN